MCAIQWRTPAGRGDPITAYGRRGVGPYHGTNVALRIEHHPELFRKLSRNRQLSTDHNIILLLHPKL